MPLSRIVGSIRPNVPLAGAVPGPSVVQLLADPAPFCKAYSSRQVPLSTDPVTLTGAVTSLPSAGEVIDTTGGGVGSKTCTIASSLTVENVSLAVRRRV